MSTATMPMMMQGMMDPQAMQDAIQICQECHTHCLREAMQKCIESGGPHVEPHHLRLMLNCAQMCQTCADFMLSDSPLHAKVCGVCAEVCDACAASCDTIPDMQECATMCRRCAESCRMMAQM